MSYTIVVDSSAQLPESFIRDRGITVLPSNFSFNGNDFQGHFSEAKLAEIYKSGKLTNRSKVRSSPIGGTELTNFMVEKIIPKYDTAICQTDAKEHSSAYENYKNSITSILTESRRVRRNLRLNRPFRMNYMSTGNTSSGQGLVAVYADSLLVKGCEYNKCKAEVELFKEFTKTYTIINGTVYSRNKAKLRGFSYAKALLMNANGKVPIVCNNDEKTWVTGSSPKFEDAVNRTFKYSVDRIKEGLYFKTMIVSIADDISELDNFTSYQELQRVAEQEDVTILVNVMSLAVASNYGPGSVALGIAPNNTMVEP